MLIKKIIYKLFNGRFLSNKDITEIIRNKIIKGGGTVGKHLDLYNAKLDINYPYLIHIGDDVTITNAIVLAHDACVRKKMGYTKVMGINIGNNVFIGAGAIVLCGCKIGDNVIIGAGSVVVTDIPNNSVAVGNPAKVIKSYDSLLEKEIKKMKRYLVCECFPNEIPNNPHLVKQIREFGGVYVK